MAENKEEAVELIKKFFYHYQIPLKVEKVNINESQIVAAYQEEKKIDAYNLGFFRKMEMAKLQSCCWK